MNISPSAIKATEEAVADAMYEHCRESNLEGYGQIARAALEAATPHIAAQALREAADEWWSRNHSLGPSDWLSTRAAALEAKP